jgi:hypothetical protein
MSYSDNPYSAHGSMISTQRNMFLISSIAISLIGFSNIFELEVVKTYIKILGLVIFCMSIYTGISAANEFSYYLDKSKELPDNIHIKSWKRWKYISYIYSLIISMVALLFLNRKLVKFNIRSLKANS